MNGFPWLSFLIFLPCVGAVVLLLLGRRKEADPFRIAIGFAGLSLLCVLILWATFDRTSTVMQFQERHAWVPGLGIEYHLAVDGMSMTMLLLSAIVVLIGLVAARHEKEDAALHFALVLLLETCLFGTFSSLNFIHWFTFWELSLVPAFFLIKLWGGPARSAAATQFLVYTMVGSVTMLLSFIALYLGTGKFDLLELSGLAQHGLLMPMVASKISLGHLSQQDLALLIFIGVFLGFAVKVPIIPFHTWLPPAYSEARSSTNILLTGAMSKMGSYGLLRIVLPIFGVQVQRVLTPLLWLAIASIVLSALAALAQKDLKRVFAYSSINHLGYCLLGIFATACFTGNDAALLAEKSAALSGVLLQVFNHALTAAVIFWFLSMLEERSGGLRGIDDFGGLRRKAPVFAGLMGIALFSSMGLPGLNGFIGEFLIFKGTFPLTTWATAWALLGLLITAVFILGVIQKVFSGPLNMRWNAFPDLTQTERLWLAVPIALMLLLGLYPQLLLAETNATTLHLLQQMKFAALLQH